MSEKRRLNQLMWQALIIGLLVMPAAVLADNLIYGSVGAGVARIGYPDNQFFADRGEAAPFARNSNLDTDKGNAMGTALDARIGTSLPFTIGKSDATRIELQGFWVNADRSTSRRFTDAGAGMRFGWVHLDNSTGFGTPNGGTLNTTVKQDLNYWGADAMLLVDYKVGSNASWSLQAGPSLKRLNQDTDATGTISTRVTLQERLSTDFRGFKIGAKYSRDLNADWFVCLDASLAKYWSKAEYRASYVDTTPAMVSASLDKNDSAVGIDLRFELGYKLTDTVKVSTFAQINYLSDVPRVNYGSVPTDPGNGVLSLTSGKLTTTEFGIQFSGSF